MAQILPCRFTSKSRGREKQDGGVVICRSTKAKRTDIPSTTAPEVDPSLLAPPRLSPHPPPRRSEQVPGVSEAPPQDQAQDNTTHTHTGQHHVTYQCPTHTHSAIKKPYRFVLSLPMLFLECHSILQLRGISANVAARDISIVMTVLA
mmetsp:Transcript_931/g.2274  ORF Transcript_931/g.2274 Transcript_931/m.2274 type:complete len:148 (+) Transcript_931:404-847(+)